MNQTFGILAVIVALITGSTALGQTSEIKLDTPQPKITTVSAMRVRRGPGVQTEEIMRLKIGTVVDALTRSTVEDTIVGKTDFWYSVKLPNGQTGWLFGGLLIDYSPQQHTQLVRQLIEARLKTEEPEFADVAEIYNLAATAVSQSKDVNTRAQFELLKLLALASWARTVPGDLPDKSPYREWHKAHDAEVIRNEFGGGYNLKTELLWQLERKYHTLRIADRIAWQAAKNPRPSDCEGDEVCYFFLYDGAIKYLSLHPNGAHAVEAIKGLTEALSDEVIKRANAKDPDRYAVEERVALRKMFASLRLALTKVSASEKTGLLAKLDRIRR